MLKIFIKFWFHSFKEGGVISYPLNMHTKWRPAHKTTVLIFTDRHLTLQLERVTVTAYIPLKIEKTYPKVTFINGYSF